jgi:hypothetical protein
LGDLGRICLRECLQESVLSRQVFGLHEVRFMPRQSYEVALQLLPLVLSQWRGLRLLNQFS